MCIFRIYFILYFLKLPACRGFHHDLLGTFVTFDTHNLRNNYWLDEVWLPNNHKRNSVLIPVRLIVGKIAIIL